MAGNSFGELFKLTSFGESHGIAIGGVIDGCPSNFELDLKEVQNQLDRRKPGQSVLTTQRKESDTVEFISGLFEGKTLGTPISFLLKNEDQKSKDYDRIGQVFRPSHADYTTEQKYGIRDYRGGGRSSARETAVRVVAGAIAQQILKKLGVEIYAYVSQVGSIKLTQEYAEVNPVDIDKNIVRCPDAETAERMATYIKQVRAEGDTVGGMVTCVVKNCPIGIGEPVYDRLNADLAKAMFSINAVKGFELGSGFDAISMKGSAHNDSFVKVGDNISTKTNFSGGIQGGISNGQDIYFNVAFKPVATIIKNQSTINTKGESVEFKGEGRHDPCVVPRAVPIVDAMSALVILDHYLRHKATIQF